MRGQFSITFDIVTPESAELGDSAERGFIDEACTLREAWQRLQYEGHAVESDEWPMRSPLALYFAASTDYRTAAETTLALHMPNNATTASRLRVARLFGLRP